MIFKIGSSLISRDIIFNEKVFLMLLGIPLRIGLFKIWNPIGIWKFLLIGQAIV